LTSDTSRLNARPMTSPPFPSRLGSPVGANPRSRLSFSASCHGTPNSELTAAVVRMTFDRNPSLHKWAIVARVQRSYRVGVSDPLRPDFPEYGYRFLKQYAFSTNTAGVSPQALYTKPRTTRQGNRVLLNQAGTRSFPCHLLLSASVPYPLQIKTWSRQ
jgi:hypothetical protein